VHFVDGTNRRADFKCCHSAVQQFNFLVRDANQKTLYIARSRFSPPMSTFVSRWWHMRTPRAAIHSCAVLRRTDANGGCVFPQFQAPPPPSRTAPRPARACSDLLRELKSSGGGAPAGFAEMIAAHPAEAERWWGMLDDLAARDDEGYRRFIQQQFDAAKAEAAGKKLLHPTAGCVLRAVITGVDEGGGRLGRGTCKVGPESGRPPPAALPVAVSPGHTLFVNLVSHSACQPPQMPGGGTVVEWEAARKRALPLESALQLSIGLLLSPVRPVKGSAKSEWATDALMHKWAVTRVEEDAAFADPHFFSFLAACLEEEWGVRVERWRLERDVTYTAGGGGKGAEPLSFEIVAKPPAPAEAAGGSGSSGSRATPPASAAATAGRGGTLLEPTRSDPAVLRVVGSMSGAAGTPSAPGGKPAPLIREVVDPVAPSDRVPRAPAASSATTTASPLPPTSSSAAYTPVGASSTAPASGGGGRGVVTCEVPAHTLTAPGTACASQCLLEGAVWGVVYAPPPDGSPQSPHTFTISWPGWKPAAAAPLQSRDLLLDVADACITVTHAPPPTGVAQLPVLTIALPPALAFGGWRFCDTPPPAPSDGRDGGVGDSSAAAVRARFRGKTQVLVVDVFVLPPAGGAAGADAVETLR